MIRACLALAAAATLISAAAHAQAPCSLLTTDQIKAVLNSAGGPLIGCPIHRGTR